MSSVFELNAPGRGEYGRVGEGRVRFTDEVRKRPEFHLPDELAGRTPVNGTEIRRKLEQAKELLRTGKLKAECPAAELVAETAKGIAVHCRVERSMVTAHDDPHSLLNFCLQPGGCELCPTWRAEKARRVAAPLVSEHEGV